MLKRTTIFCAVALMFALWLVTTYPPQPIMPFYDCRIVGKQEAHGPC